MKCQNPDCKHDIHFHDHYWGICRVDGCKCSEFEAEQKKIAEPFEYASYGIKFEDLKKGV